MPDREEDILPPLLVGAVALHENLMSFIQAGFTREESLQIVMMMLRESIRQNPASAGGEGNSNGGR